MSDTLLYDEPGKMISEQMSIKFAEASMAVKFRKFNPDGSVSGGPMHYIAHGLTRKGLRWLGQPLAMFFAILLIIICNLQLLSISLLDYAKTMAYNSSRKFTK